MAPFPAPIPPPAQTGRTRIKPITTPSHFDTIVSEYTRSHEASTPASPFSSHAWVSASWHADPKVRNGRVQAISGSGAPTFIATFDQWGSYFKVPVLRRRLFGSDHGVTTIGGTADAGALAEWLDAELSPFVVFQMGPLLTGTDLQTEMAEVLVSRGRHIHTAVARNPYLMLPGSWDEFMSDRSKNFRRSVSRKFRDFEAHGGFTVSVSHRPSAEEILDVVVPVSRTSWQGKEEVSVLHSAGREFYERLAANDDLSLHLATIRESGVPAGYLIGVIEGSTYHAYETAFDPRYSDASPGFILHISAIQDLIERSIDELNFGFDAPYKSRFSPEYRELPTLSIFGSGVLGRIAATTRSRYDEPDSFNVMAR